MDKEEPGSKAERLNEKTRRVWDKIAEWWDDRIGDGNRFQNELIEPATERLLEIGSGTTVLDIACGAGRFARRMAELGARVVAFDFSKQFIERAKARTPAGSTIEYRVIDATKREALLGLGTNCFDGAVATMALMDMANIEPLMSTLPLLLKPGGWFIFSVMHPCFWSPGARRFAEAEETEGEEIITAGIKISHYLTPKEWKGAGIIGQPEALYYFHRPMQVLFNTGFRNGFVIDGFEEAGFADKRSDDRYLRWDYMTEIPTALVVRMRLVNKEDSKTTK